MQTIQNSFEVGMCTHEATHSLRCGQEEDACMQVCKCASMYACVDMHACMFLCTDVYTDGRKAMDNVYGRKVQSVS